MDDLRKYEWQILMRPAWMLINGIPPDTLVEVLKATDAAFDAWKQSQADENGSVAIGVRGGGLLGLNARPVGRKPWNEAEAWEIHDGGYPVTNDIDFSLKLWAENFAPFMAAIESFGAGVVLSVIALRSGPAVVNTSSLIHLNGILWDFALAGKGAVGSRDNGPKARRSNGGNTGSAARGAGKHLKMLEREEQIRQAAHQLKRKFPDDGSDDIADKTHKIVTQWVGYGHYARTTIRRILSGQFGSRRPRKSSSRPR